MKIKRFIDENKSWNIGKLYEVFPKYIVYKIISIPIPMNDIRDKLFGNLSGGKNFS